MESIMDGCDISISLPPIQFEWIDGFERCDCVWVVEKCTYVYVWALLHNHWVKSKEQTFCTICHWPRNASVVIFSGSFFECVCQMFSFYWHWILGNVIVRHCDSCKKRFVSIKRIFCWKNKIFWISEIRGEKSIGMEDVETNISFEQCFRHVTEQKSWFKWHLSDIGVTKVQCGPFKCLEMAAVDNCWKQYRLHLNVQLHV